MRVAFFIAALLLLAGCGSVNRDSPGGATPEIATSSYLTFAELATHRVFRSGLAEFMPGGEKELDRGFEHLPPAATLDLYIFREDDPIRINSPRSRYELDRNRLASVKSFAEARGFRVRRLIGEGTSKKDGVQNTARIEVVAVSPAELAIIDPARIDLGSRVFRPGAWTFEENARSITRCERSQSRP